MTERKWTPGPWVVIDRDQVWADNLVCTVCNNETANLIASAPDLYEALDRLAYLQSGGPCAGIEAEQWLTEAREALAKARGEIK